jgi:RNA polymerase sigma-70 factor (ECF subfamily)
MPPLPLWLVGRQGAHDFMLGPGAKCRGSRLVPTSANGGPAVAVYNRDEQGWHAWAIVVVEASAGGISGLHHFIFPDLFTEFGLPLRLEPEDA